VVAATVLIKPFRWNLLPTMLLAHPRQTGPANLFPNATSNASHHEPGMIFCYPPLIKACHSKGFHIPTIIHDYFTDSKGTTFDLAFIMRSLMKKNDQEF
jgi:hypothetical protein